MIMRTLSVKQHKFVKPPFYALPGNNPRYVALIHCPQKSIKIEASLPKSFSFNALAQYSGSYLDRIPGSSIIEPFNSTYNVFGGSFNTKALTSQVWQGSEPWQFNLELHFVFENNLESNVRKPIADLLRLTVPEEKEDGDLLGAPGPHLDFKLLMDAAKSELEKSGLPENAKKAYGAGKNAAESVVSNPVNTFKSLAGSGTSLVSSALDPSKASEAVSSAWTGAVNATKSTFRHVSRAIERATVNTISLSLGHHWYFPSVVITNVALENKTLPTESGKMKIIVADVSFSTFYVPTSRDIDRMYSPVKE